MVEELGDVLLQVIFHCQIGNEEGYFDLKEVVNGICKKLIHRHPHIFSGAKLDMSKFENLGRIKERRERRKYYNRWPQKDTKTFTSSYEGQ